MKKLLAFCVFGLTIVVSNSCKNDLDSLSPYRESIAVYSLIDQSDSVNYIRVNRVFLGDGDANQIAQIKDSVYFKPGEATVYIEKYWNGSKRQTLLFSETYEKPLNAGAFNADQLIYKSIQKFRSDSAGKFFEYKLVVKNNVSGKEFTSKNVKLIKDINLASGTGSVCSGAIGSNCFFNQSNVSILPGATAVTKVWVTAPQNALIAGFRMKFYYHSIYTDNSIANKFVSFNKDNQYPDAGTTVDYSFGGKDFFTTLGTAIPAEANISERVADSMSFVFTFGGEEYKYYQQINNTSGTFGQEKPIYTNMNDDAIGLFSSRTKVTVIKKMWDATGPTVQTNVLTLATLTELRANQLTCHLRLRGPNWPAAPGC